MLHKNRHKAKYHEVSLIYVKQGTNKESKKDCLEGNKRIDLLQMGRDPRDLGKRVKEKGLENK